MQTMALIPLIGFLWVVCFVGSLIIIDEAFGTNIRWDLKNFLTKLGDRNEIT